MSKSEGMKLGGYIISVLGAGILIYNTFHVPLAKAITEEKDCRIEDTNKIRKDFTEALLDQKEVNTQLLVAITKLNGSMENIKEKSRVR